MPPAVQNRVPGPAPQSSRFSKPAALEQSPEAAGADFRSELVRHRKDKAKPRAAADTEPAKPSRPDKPRRTRGPSSKSKSSGPTDENTEAAAQAAPSPADGATATPPIESGADETFATPTEGEGAKGAKADVRASTEMSDTTAPMAVTVPRPASPAAEDSVTSPAVDGNGGPKDAPAPLTISERAAVDGMDGSMDAVDRSGVPAEILGELLGEDASTGDAAAADSEMIETEAEATGIARAVRRPIQTGARDDENAASDGNGGDNAAAERTSAELNPPVDSDNADARASYAPLKPGESPSLEALSIKPGNPETSTTPTLDLPGRPAPAPVATTAPAPAPDDATPPELRFAAANHDNIVKSMRAEVLPNGGTMRIRLDPPQLGALQVTVQIRDGVVTAAFETSNDEATRLLGHSLNQLKGVLESHGVGVDRLQVQQSPRNEPQTGPRDSQQDRSQSNPERDHAARQEQQRREMLQKMWRKLAGGGDPLDVTV